MPNQLLLFPQALASLTFVAGCTGWTRGSARRCWRHAATGEALRGEERAGEP